jgi:hypothetical protein
MDPKADRKNSVTLIKAIYLEKPEFITDEFFHAFAACLRTFAEFHNCPSIKIERVVPNKYKRSIMKLL